MMITRSLSVVLCLGLLAGSALAQDPLGKGKGKGNQGGGGGGKSDPPKNNNNNNNQGNQGGLGKGNGGGNSGGGNSGGGIKFDPPRNQGIPDRGGNNDLGRINNGGGRPTGNDVLGRGRDKGRLGAPGYSSNNNIGAQNNGGPRGDVRFNAPSLNKGSISSQALRIPEARPGNGRGNRFEQDGWRTGYWGYNNNWRDDSFWYSNYVFNPWDNHCTISPWYFYPNLPGYITIKRISFFDNGGFGWSNANGWDRWNDWSRWDNNNGWGNNNNNNNGWGNDRWRDRDDQDAYEAIDDLRRAFDRQDRRSLGNLIPRNGRVNIYHNGRYSYSLDSDDYYDLMLDAIYSTRTIRYEIEDVRRSRGQIRVSARHWYQTPWGTRTSVCHMFRLEEDRNGYVITDFGTGYDYLR
jgi:hypothetical protein